MLEKALERTADVRGGARCRKHRIPASRQNSPDRAGTAASLVTHIRVLKFNSQIGHGEACQRAGHGGAEVAAGAVLNGGKRLKSLGERLGIGFRALVAVERFV